jgi:hypothetical protein
VSAGDLGRLTRRLRRQPCGRDVLVEKRRRDAQRRGDVVEAIDFDLGRQQRLGVELDAQQIVDGRPVLGARHALHRDVTGDRALVASAFWRTRGCAIEL